MHTAINQIIQQFFRKDNLDQVSKDELKKFVEDYPYATVGHILLAKKEADTGNRSEETLRTTALYMNNPLWLQWILDDSKFHEQKELTIRERQPEFTAPDPISGADTETEAAEGPADESTILAANEVQAIHTASAQNGSGNKDLVAEPESFTQTNREENGSGMREPVNERETFRQSDDESGGIRKSELTQETETFAQGEAEVDQTEKNDEDNDQEMPVFQSYHTIDYFASQGIRLQPADLAKDKLGQQLRSFTDWLRSMKKLPQTTTGDEDPAEQTVRVIAEHSIEEREVLTEAMAEVWAKQGNRQKASEIYRKLSLLNPAKSAYFAAKIDQL